jgi:hypothetical protein
VKWEGSDRVHYNLPDRYEYVELRKKGIRAPKDSAEEEYYLAWITNEMGAQGWEPVTLHSRRILFKREKAE